MAIYILRRYLVSRFFQISAIVLVTIFLFYTFSHRKHHASQLRFSELGLDFNLGILNRSRNINSIIRLQSLTRHSDSQRRDSTRSWRHGLNTNLQWSNGTNLKSSKCFHSPYILCPGETVSFDNIFFEGVYERKEAMFGANQTNQEAVKPNRTDGLWKIRQKLQRRDPVVFNFYNYFDEHQMPDRNFPCLRNSCVYRIGDVTEVDDVIVVRIVGLNENAGSIKRWPGQLFLFDELEAPAYYGNFLNDDNTSWRYQFNLTTTYSPSSDIFHPYNPLRFEPIPPEERPNYYELAKNKTKNAVWLASNCHTVGRRESYIQEMKKYIDVDVFGDCGNQTTCLGQRVPCLKKLFQPYRFYLAFENSMCQDYITEKLFKVYAPGLHIIPVVQGKNNYSRYFPPKTFIDSSQFLSAKELSLHLLKLASDAGVYAELLQVIDEYHSLDSPDHYCTMCNAVTSLKLKPKIYDISKWITNQC
uniref:Fucosyltransferase n=1 Tax=Biomphalaria glabrata TaxID=6526 RepID=A0A2C9L7M2_BIOGL